MTRARSIVLCAILLAPLPVAAAFGAEPDASDLSASPALVREGQHLVDADGVLRLLDEGWVFETVFMGRVRSFTVSPTLRLGELEQVVGARGEGRYRLSGRVYVHGERNYLMLRSFSASGAEDDAPLTDVSLTGGPTVADLVRDFERQRTERPRGPGRAGERNREATPVHREGAMLKMTRGRVLQNPAGWAYFEPLAPEGALEPDASSTLPVMMLPSLMLEELEALAAFSPEPPVVTLAGEYFAHQGRNYLMPSMYLVERSPSRETEGALPSLVGETNR